MTAAWKVQSHSGIERFADDARELFGLQGGQLQFDQSLPWFETFARHAVPTDADRLFLTWKGEGERVVAALALLRRRLPGLAGGVTLRSMSNYYSSLFAPVVDERSMSVTQLTESFVGVLQSQLGRWDTFEVDPLAAGDGWLGSLAAQLGDAGIAAQTFFRFGNWYLEVGGRSFDEYFRALGAQLRNTVNRREKRFRRAGAVAVRIVQGGEELEEAIAAYQQVYAASWKKPEPFTDFVPALARAMAAQGWLRLGVATLDGRPAAAQLWFVKDGVASIFKLAYDEKLAEFSPGSLVTTTLMRHAIDVDRVRQVDYLTGDDGYKRDWMSHRRERFGLMAFNRTTPRGLAAFIRHRLGPVVGRLLRRDRQRR